MVEIAIHFWQKRERWNEENSLTIDVLGKYNMYSWRDERETSTPRPGEKLIAKK